MNSTLQEITDTVLAWPKRDREFLADKLVQSLDPVDREEIDRLWVIEAKRRLAEVKSGLVQPIDADEVFAHVRTSLDK